jgi:hypothetical protein
MDVPDKKSIGKVGKSIGKRVGSFVSTVGDRLTRPIELNILPRSKLAVLPSERAPNTNTVRKPQNKNFGMKSRSQRGGKKGGKKTKRNMRKRGTQKRR